MTATDIPLFPLNTALFPGGVLELRVFERRYLDLVRDCARSGAGFGVCLILHGQEAGEPAVPAAVGTLAHIVDFYTTDDGLLGIRADGGERFRIARTRVRDNGLVHGDAHFWPDEPAVPVPPEFALLATILERLLERTGGAHARVERERYDDASWVGFRLGEALPLENRERQHLLQMTDPLARLQQLMHYLPRFQRV
ncbi:MAG: LON peptidase substrate-binding domain-containing protein [Xanthomonadaceae bacterium]|nr:LON peptidase substrate-binding domain-containing protein [Xanthomonadaceae bacterium]MDE1884701.1 LON peptidase substrate-binding domain-containing protein [Xanthomonadaceae bacterium]MDE1960860.1 LON peptidase substrate-binding domain-containing protein [Xanthomonadaceae bacterium]MDE2083742.1 LON peptidase substrate-binding domain-containing protein [Xanthomonadaceae bacterium]MDE2256353.1 LON peptidase substrate-binding domain-containing protein [Xanthomonadaceae bacterium]